MTTDGTERLIGMGYGMVSALLAVGVIGFFLPELAKFGVPAALIVFVTTYRYDRSVQTETEGTQ